MLHYDELKQAVDNGYVKGVRLVWSEKKGRFLIMFYQMNL
ncbi:Uncharacterised protein [Streptococcus agalactiae]|nr:Uncharacterised protein [Streptococcus agalactiae]